jgi:hypothetical protein
MKKTLFICKKNETYGFTSYTRRSSGLFNSTRFIVESLLARGEQAKIIEVHDNKDIDREVTRYGATTVIIEAFWVVPSKFIELKRLHPNVRWFVHLHSHIPFLALEGIAIEWLYGCADLGVNFIANSEPSFQALKAIFPHHAAGKLLYLPNVYLMDETNEVWGDYKRPESAEINLGCFGAMRPLKNQLLQAMAAIKFADQIQKPLRFHINASRLETGGQPVMKNMLALFGHYPKHKLIQHAWHEPEDFLAQLRMKIDIGMQVSLTETFNVVSADYVTAGIPVVASKEVSWLNPFSKAKDDDIDSIVSRMHLNYNHRILIKWNRARLARYSARAQHMWHQFVK